MDAKTAMTLRNAVSVELHCSFHCYFKYPAEHQNFAVAWNESNQNFAVSWNFKSMGLGLVLRHP